MWVGLKLNGCGLNELSERERERENLSNAVLALVASI